MLEYFNFLLDLYFFTIAERKFFVEERKFFVAESDASKRLLMFLVRNDRILRRILHFQASLAGGGRGHLEQFQTLDSRKQALHSARGHRGRGQGDRGRGQGGRDRRGGGCRGGRRGCRSGHHYHLVDLIFVVALIEQLLERWLLVHRAVEPRGGSRTYVWCELNFVDEFGVSHRFFLAWSCIGD